MTEITTFAGLIAALRAGGVYTAYRRAESTYTLRYRNGSYELQEDAGVPVRYPNLDNALTGLLMAIGMVEARNG